MGIGIVGRMVLGRMHFVAFYLKHRMRRLAIGMKGRRIGAIVTDDIERLVEIRPAALDVVDMALIHRHDGLSGMHSARMAVGRLVQILHAVQYGLLEYAVKVYIVENLFADAAIVEGCIWNIRVPLPYNDLVYIMCKVRDKIQILFWRKH